VADFLAAQPNVTRVWYPARADHPQQALAMAQMTAGGTLVSFEVAGGKPAAFRFANALSLIDISNNLGDAKSLLTHPETTTHMKLTQAARDAQGVTGGLMRLSVGLEDAEDLCEDLGQALKAI
jgi:O-succinylhomoserine sulfhydrylase